MCMVESGAAFARMMAVVAVMDGRARDVNSSPAWRSMCRTGVDLPNNMQLMLEQF